MRCATGLDMQQSECQNPLERTFFSRCSRISCLSKKTRNPVRCSFLHYDNRRKGARVRTADIGDSRQSAWQRLTRQQVGATLEAKGEQTGNTKQTPHTESSWCLVLTQLCGRSRSTETALTTFNRGLRRTERSCIQLGDVMFATL